MALKQFRPTSPGRRQLVIVDRAELHKGKPVKALTVGLAKSGGRNNMGRVTAFRHGGGHKRAYRVIDFKRRKWNDAATVQRLEYDPNRTAFIALIKYGDGELAYILAPQRLKVGDAAIAAPQGLGSLSYDDGCTIDVNPATIAWISAQSPCAADGARALSQDPAPVLQPRVKFDPNWLRDGAALIDGRKPAAGP